jgi:dihydrofolate reductase
MEICLIWAQDRNRAIGKNNTLPWRSPADLRHFKEMTKGHAVIMGRKTWESLPFKPLPGRQNYVLSRQPQDLTGAIPCQSLQDALLLAGYGNPTKVFIIGGQALYEQAARIADTLYVTQVGVAVPGADAFAPVIDESRYALDSQTPATDGDLELVFEVYRRRRQLR